MALKRTPPKVHPAFNEIVVIDDVATSLSIIHFGLESVQSYELRRVNMNGETVFDLKGIVSKLFRDYRSVVVATGDYKPWIFRDWRLQAVYMSTDGASRYMALNAVRQPGETLDLYNEDASPILSDRAKSNPLLITIPCYEGFPVGVSVLYREKYTLPDIGFTANPNPVNFTSGGGSQIISVTTNYEITGVSATPWMTVVRQDDKTYTATVARHVGTESRAGEITFTTSNGVFKVGVSQEYEAAYFSYTPASILIGASGGARQLSITTNHPDWQGVVTIASPSPGMIEVAKISNYLFSISISENTTGASRAAGVQFRNPISDELHTVVITQEADVQAIEYTASWGEFVRGLERATITASASWGDFVKGLKLVE